MWMASPLKRYVDSFGTPLKMVDIIISIIRSLLQTVPSIVIRIIPGWLSALKKSQYHNLSMTRWKSTVQPMEALKALWPR